MTSHVFERKGEAGEGRADLPVDRDERRVRAMVDALERLTPSSANSGDEARTAALRTLLDYGEIVSGPARRAEQH